MTTFFKCRRTLVSLAGIASLTYLGYRGHEVADAIAATAIGLSAANAWQALRAKSATNPTPSPSEEPK